MAPARFTMLFEGVVIAWPRAASQSAVAGQFGLSWDEVHGIMDRAVRRGLPLWEYQSETWARKHFQKWYNWATHRRLEPMIEKAKMLQRRLDNVLTHTRHRITNAVSEGLNSIIQWVKSTARGFRNFDNFTTAIYLHSGKLDLKPSH